MSVPKKVRLLLLVIVTLVATIKASQTSEGNSNDSSNSLMNTTSTPSLQPMAFYFNGVLATSSEAAVNRSHNYNNSQANINFWFFGGTSSSLDKTNCECYNPNEICCVPVKPQLSPFCIPKTSKCCGNTWCRSEESCCDHVGTAEKGCCPSGTSCRKTGTGCCPLGKSCVGSSVCQDHGSTQCSPKDITDPPFQCCPDQLPFCMTHDIYGLGCYVSSPLPAPPARIVSSSHGPISRAASIDDLSSSYLTVVSAVMPATITTTLTIFPESTSSDVGGSRGVTGGWDGMELGSISGTGSSIPSQPSRAVTASSSSSIAIESSSYSESSSSSTPSTSSSTTDITSTSSADSSSSSSSPSSSSTKKTTVSASLCWNEYRAALLPCPTPTSSSSSSSSSTSNEQLPTKDDRSSSTSRAYTVRSSTITTTKTSSATSSWYIFSTCGFFFNIINIAAVTIAVIA